MRRLLLAMLMACSTVTPAIAAPGDDLARVIDDHWRWYLRNNPVLASAAGVRDYDSELGDFSIAAMDRQAQEAGAFVARLDAIPDDGLTPAARVDKALLRRLLSEQVEGNLYGSRLMNMSILGSWFQSFAGLADVVPMRTRADYASYLARLAKFSAANAQNLDVARAAVRGGFTQPCVTLTGFDTTITGVISADPAASRFYAPFLGNRPADMTPADWSAAQARARALITDSLNPEYRKIETFYRGTYLPACRKQLAATGLRDGQRLYNYLVRRETTTTLTPEQIHQTGLDEVTRIRAEMDAVASKAGYPTRAAFIAALRTDPRFYPRSAGELMAAAALQAKTIDGKMPSLFATLPRLPYGVRAIPAETAEGATTAYYMPGSPRTGISGTFYVNTSKLSQRPLYELPALTAHEAVPGHHNQIALQQELKLPAFRRYAAYFTAFTEGWGLYSERLGIEMGLYDTPEKDMGRLSYEMWRACRLVVDTGIHAKGWSKERAVAFMKENTALTDANIDAEVNRYITNPGQALGYKLGELKIRALRARAEKALGDRFDIRRFHDAVLAQGSVPLDVLEQQVDEWIAGQR
jgi:uncharacterized protein (DUF885 family)